MARNLKEAVLIEYTRANFDTPVTQGEVFGTMTYYPDDGGSAVRYELTASRSIARRENAPKSIEEIEAATYADPNPFPPLTVETGLLMLLPFAILYGLIRLLMRIFRRNSKPGKRSRTPRPNTRYYR